MDELIAVQSFGGVVPDYPDMLRLSYLEIVTFRPVLSSEVPFFINWKYLSAEFRVDCFGG